MRVTETNTLFFIYLTLLPIKMSFLDNEVCLLILIAFLPKHTFSMIKKEIITLFRRYKPKHLPLFPLFAFGLYFSAKQFGRNYRPNWAILPTNFAQFGFQNRLIWFADNTWVRDNIIQKEFAYIIIFKKFIKTYLISIMKKKLHTKVSALRL